MGWLHYAIFMLVKWVGPSSKRKKYALFGVLTVTYVVCKSYIKLSMTLQISHPLIVNTNICYEYHVHHFVNTM